MKKTLVIAFNGGAYGTYLEWALNSLMSTHCLREPFTDLGNSHRSELGHHLRNIDGFRAYIQSDSNFSTCRLHPKTAKEESLQDNLEFLLDNVSHVILLYPDREHELMCVCNYMTQIWRCDPYDGPMAYVNPNDIYQGYDISPGTDIRKIPIWMRREHMSFSLFSSWHDQVEWYFPDRWHNSAAMVITTKELFEHFTDVLMRIEDFLGIEYTRDIDDLLPAHDKMIKLQPHLGKDQLCNSIIRAVIDDTADKVEFDNICQTSQAWIQYQLRQQGYELQCHDLNIFPTNTDQLRSLVYRNN